MKDAYDFNDAYTTDWTALAAILQRFGALAASDHVMARTEHRVAHAVHADCTLAVSVCTVRICNRDANYIVTTIRA